MPGDDTKRIHVTSFDFDHCILPKGEGIQVQTHEDVRRANQTLLNAVKRQNNEAFTVAIGLIGSNRQDVSIDDGNRERGESTPANRHEDPHSCFVTVKRLVEEDTDATFNPYLLADTYSRDADGAAYQQAIDPNAQADDTAHARYVFDDDKTSLIYAQVHTIANNARNCDFLAVDDLEGEGALFEIPKKSNAAYVYVKSTQSLYYVNDIEETAVLVENKKDHVVDELVASLSDPLIKTKKPCFTRGDVENPTFGFTLSDTELATITPEGDHKHVKKDYPIVFDFFDDSREILTAIRDAFQGTGYKKGVFSSRAFERSSLLPSNVIVRLNPYDRFRRQNLSAPRIAIRGTGEIDLNPTQTLNNIAEKVRQKEGVRKLTDISESGMTDFLSDTSNMDFYETRDTVTPTVSVEESDKTYAEVHRYMTKLHDSDKSRIQHLYNKLNDEVVFLRGVDTFLNTYIPIFWISWLNFGLIDAAADCKAAKRDKLFSILHPDQQDGSPQITTQLNDLKEEEDYSATTAVGFFSHRTRDLVDSLSEKYIAPPAAAG